MRPAYGRALIRQGQTEPLPTHDTLIGLVAVGFGSAFAVAPRWWARFRKPGQLPATERQVSSDAVFFFIVGLGLLVLMAVVFVSAVA